MRHLESDIQRHCVTWFRIRHPRLKTLLFAVPNGGCRRLLEAKRMKAEGVTSGVADLLLLVPSARHHGLCVELKTPKGRQSPSQKEWQAAVTEQGYRYEVCRSLAQFTELIENYLSND